MRTDKSDKILACLRLLSGLAAHIFALAYVIMTWYIASPGSSLFSWHPVSMSLGLALVMLEAILIFSPESSLLAAASRKSKVRAHWILQSISLALAWVGFVAIVTNKVFHQKSHFRSWHGTLGLITVIYITMQASFGILLLYPSAAKRWNWKLVQLKVYHATFGLVGFILAIVTMITALYSNFMLNNADTAVWWWSLIALVWMALFVMNQVSNTTSHYMARTSVPL